MLAINRLSKRYRTLLTAQPLLELALGAYLTSAIWFALDKGVYFSLPFLLLFQCLLSSIWDHPFRGVRRNR